MKLLALESSSRQFSVALLEDVRLVAEASWMDQRGGPRNIFTTIAELLARAAWESADIDVYAVGRGPGAYAGLRAALAAAQALALPGRRPVHAVSSGEVLAHDAARRAGAARIAVVGDARRGRTWYRVFRAEGDRVAAEGDWSLASLGDLGSRLPADAVIASPDWSLLSKALAGTPLSGRNWVEEDCFPLARTLGEIVCRRIGQGIPSEPLTPIYMHPPVWKIG